MEKEYYIENNQLVEKYNRQLIYVSDIDEIVVEGKYIYVYGSLMIEKGKEGRRTKEDLEDEYLRIELSKPLLSLVEQVAFLNHIEVDNINKKKIPMMLYIFSPLFLLIIILIIINVMAKM